MKTVLAIGASTSRSSINRQFAGWAASQLEGVEAHVLDLNDFPVPMFSVDVEEEVGQPEQAKRFLETIQNTDGIIISLAEHNGSYAAGFKSLLDWTSRIDPKLWSGKPMLLLSTSPGKRGGATVRETASGLFPRLGAQLAGSFGLGSYYETFDVHDGIKDSELASAFGMELGKFKDALLKT